ncbi:Putative uncharacterized protein [Lactobacillus delbrueckii subsp. lactis]|nr:Putative uncharacterized protein [Lactobacillus delbrueckii subsp. lactis]
MQAAGAQGNQDIRIR